MPCCVFGATVHQSWQLIEVVDSQAHVSRIQLQSVQHEQKFTLFAALGDFIGLTRIPMSETPLTVAHLRLKSRAGTLAMEHVQSQPRVLVWVSCTERVHEGVYFCLNAIGLDL